MNSIHAATIDDISPSALYKIMRLRSAVFVVDQKCVFLDPDGRDLEPSTMQLWIEEEGDVVSSLRVLHQPSGATRISRVVTAPSARGKGYAAALVSDVLDNESGEVEIDAQEYLQGWYERMGFVASGEIFLEDGIKHVPMTLRR